MKSEILVSDSTTRATVFVRYLLVDIQKDGSGKFVADPKTNWKPGVKSTGTRTLP